MKSKVAITRRSFVTGATLGAAALGLCWPSPVGSAEPGTPYHPASGLGNAAAEPEPLMLSRNESPYGLPPSSLEAILAALAKKANRYPGAEADKLVEGIAKKFGVEKEQVVLGCGSTEILKMATEAFCSPGHPPVVAEPTFEAVVQYSPLVHSRAIKVPVDREYQHNMARMWSAAGQGAGMIFFCNPANPTGTYINKERVEKYVRKLPHGVVLLADEAYWDYVESLNFESCVRYVKEGRPVVVSRTFSKVYAMAGLRIGYAIGPKKLIKRMERRRLGNNPNQVASAAALAALKEDEFVARVRELNSQVRDFMYSELRGMNLPFIASQTNFVMINLGRPAKPVVEELKKRRVLVGRVFPAMPNHMRVSLGTVDEMKSFLKEFGQVISTPAG